MTLSKKHINIIGAGLAGSLLSVYFAKKGYNVDLFERRADMRKIDMSAGKSINLALSARGLYALHEVGLEDEIKRLAIPMFGRMVHLPNGEVQMQRYGKDDSEYINAISRADLNKKLMDLAESFCKDECSIKIHFNHRCSGMDFNKEEIFFVNDETGEKRTVKGSCIAADGATSAVRMEMQKLPRFNFSQEYENYGYKELTIPAAADGAHKMHKNALHIWPRGSYMLIALPNTDGSFTCTLFLPYDKSFAGQNSFEALSTPETVRKFFDEHFTDAVPLLENLEEQFFANPTGTLMTVKCYPWSVKDKALLIGDAAHAIVPFFGQGMNAAFEDCTILSGLLDKHSDWAKAFDEFERTRKPDADAIADLAQENFIEMRDLVANERFQKMKKLEAELHKRYPQKFVPKYSMVTFHRIPYSTALQRGKIQHEIMDKLLKDSGETLDVDYAKAERMITEMPDFK